MGPMARESNRSTSKRDPLLALLGDVSAGERVGPVTTTAKTLRRYVKLLPLSKCSTSMSITSQYKVRMDFAQHASQYNCPASSFFCSIAESHSSDTLLSPADCLLISF